MPPLALTLFAELFTLHPAKLNFVSRLPPGKPASGVYPKTDGASENRPGDLEKREGEREKEKYRVKERDRERERKQGRS